MKKLFACLWCAIFALNCGLTAQDFNNYSLLKSSGKVPETFMKSARQKAEEQINTTLEGARHKRKKKEFIKESNYMIDDLLLSGRVLFNDPIGRYCNKIVDTLLRNDTALRNHIEVYVVKSAVVNAFTTSNGIIFIDMGLIAKLNSEAELAFVLCHEIIHYKNKHSMTEFDLTEDINNGKGSFRNTTFNDKLLAKSMFSKELEKEADMEGLKIFLNSPYSIDAAPGVFDILQYSHIPFSNVAFNKSFIETENFRLPEAYQLKQTREVVGDVEEDSLGTHPGTGLRREAIKNALDGVSNAGRVRFTGDSSAFIKLKEIAKFEVTEFYLEDRDYEAALYAAYALLQDYPGSIYLKKAVNRSLYGLAKYQSVSGRFKEIHYDYMKVQGGHQEVYFLYSRLKASEACVASLSYAWRLKKKYPQDAEIASIADDIMLTAVDNYFPKRSFFSNVADTVSYKDTSLTVIDFKAIDEAEAKSVTRQRGKKKGSEVNKSKQTKTVPAFLKYSLADIVDDPEFAKKYDALSKSKRQRIADAREKNAEKYKQQELKDYKKELQKGKPMGIDRIAFVNPFYYKISMGFTSVKVKNEAGEEAQEVFSKNVNDIAAISGLDYVMLDKKHLEEQGADAFNDIATLSSWIEEYYEHGDSMHFANYKRAEIKSLIDKYHTPYFCWTGIIAVRTPNMNIVGRYGRIILGLVMLPILPYEIYKASIPNYYTLHYSIIVNLSTGKSEYLQMHNYSSKDRNDVVQESIYDLCHQIKTPIVK